MLFHIILHCLIAGALALISRTHSEEADHTRCPEATGETNSSSSVGRPRKVRGVTFVETRSTSRRAPEKACRVNDKTLDVVHGRLRCRLNSKIPHLPHDDVKKIRSKALRCALHRWTDRNAQVKRDVMVCSTCGVALCIWCYKKFHTEPDVEKLREYVKSIDTDTTES